MGIFTKREARGADVRPGWSPGALLNRVRGRRQGAAAAPAAPAAGERFKISQYLEKVNDRVAAVKDQYGIESRPDAPEGAVMLHGVPHEYSAGTNYCSEASGIMLLHHYGINDYTQDWFHNNGYEIYEKMIRSPAFTQDLRTRTVASPTKADIAASLQRGEPVMLRYRNLPSFGGKHTVIVTGYDQNGWIVNDPDLGPGARIPYDFFEQQKDGALFVTGYGSKKKSTERRHDAHPKGWKSKYHLMGSQEGRDAAIQNLSDDEADLRKYYDEDRVGEAVQQVREHQVQMAGDISYDVGHGVTEKEYEEWDEGFTAGYISAVEEHFASVDAPKSHRCDQCEALMINKIFTHETGCPNKRKVWVDGEWVDREDEPDASADEYAVVVGNIGNVYSGSNGAEAQRIFKEYVQQSKNNYGRAAGESVTLMRNNEPLKEHFGKSESSPDAAVADEHLARELVLWAENDYDIYRQRLQPFMKNYAKKINKGIFDQRKAEMGLGNNLSNDILASYWKSAGDGPKPRLSQATKDLVGKLLWESIEEETRDVAKRMGEKAHDASALYTFETVQDAMETIRSGIKAPYVNLNFSTLGGKERTSILIAVSADSKDSWSHGYLENSHYLRIHLNQDGKMEYISGPIKFRKSHAKSLADVAERINRALETTPDARAPQFVLNNKCHKCGQKPTAEIHELHVCKGCYMKGRESVKDGAAPGEWRYDRMGCVTIDWEDGPSLFMQSEDDVESFFQKIGLKMEDVNPGDHDVLPEEADIEYRGISDIEDKYGTMDFELVYQDGGHGGPFRGYGMAASAAMDYMKGHPNTLWVDVVPYDTSPNVITRLRLGEKQSGVRIKDGYWSGGGVQYEYTPDKAPSTDGIRRYELGKFDDIIDSYVHRMSLDGAETIGSCPEMGVAFTIVEGPLTKDVIKEAATEKDTLTADEIAFLDSHSAGAILEENDQGFVTIQYFKEKEALDKAWEKLQAKVDEAYGEEFEEEEPSEGQCPACGYDTMMDVPSEGGRAMVRECSRCKHREDTPDACGKKKR